MNPKNSSTTVRTLATGLMVGGVAVTTLSATGCDKRTAEHASALTSGSFEAAADSLRVAEKPDLRSRLAGNHNETFLVSPSVLR